MNAADILNALCLPDSARVDQRVPKKLLSENAGVTAADRRRITDGIQQLTWVAALKPTTVGVPFYRDAQREYLEIAVLTAEFRSPLELPNKAARAVELVHRAIPYPLFLVASFPQHLQVSFAHKRDAQNEQNKVVLDGDPVAVDLPTADESLAVREFLRALPIARHPHTSIFTLYAGWIDAAAALLASRVTGSFVLPTGPEHATRRAQALRDCARLEDEVARLRAAAARETQMPRRVAINLDIHRAQAALASAREQL